MFDTRPGYSIACSAKDASQSLTPESFRFYTARSSPVSGLPMASLSASILSNLGKPAESGSGRMEPSTGYTFPLEYCYLRNKDCPSLAGLGVRAKKIVIKDINVYALGIYVDAAAAKGALSAFRRRPEEELQQDQAFYDAVVKAPSVEKTLRLVISSRLVDRKKFLDALDERLAPRLKEAGQPTMIDTFRTQFDGVDFHKGMEITFTCLDNKKLVTQIEGKEKGSISSPALCASLFDIYLGTDPVSKDAKATFGKSLAAALKEDK